MQLVRFFFFFFGAVEISIELEKMVLGRGRGKGAFSKEALLGYICAAASNYVGLRSPYIHHEIPIVGGIVVETSLMRPSGTGVVRNPPGVNNILRTFYWASTMTNGSSVWSFSFSLSVFFSPPPPHRSYALFVATYMRVWFCFVCVCLLGTHSRAKTKLLL